MRLLRPQLSPGAVVAHVVPTAAPETSKQTEVVTPAVVMRPQFAFDNGGRHSVETREGESLEMKPYGYLAASSVP
ncbi:MAG: hypothetical protein RLZZ387_2884 [Chloroflexota bacterium]